MVDSDTVHSPSARILVLHTETGIPQAMTPVLEPLSAEVLFHQCDALADGYRPLQSERWSAVLLIGMTQADVEHVLTMTTAPVVVVLREDAEGKATLYNAGVWDAVQLHEQDRLLQALRTAMRHSRGRFADELERMNTSALDVFAGSVPEPFLLVGPDGSIHIANESGLELSRCLGGTEEGIAIEWLEVIVQVLAEGATRRMDSYCRDSVISMTLVPFPQQQLVLMYGFDVSELARTQRRLHESETLFRLAFRNSPDSVILNRVPDGLLVDVNEGFCRLTGFSREEAIGKTTLDLNLWVNVDERLAIYDALREHGQVSNRSYQFRMKDGSVVDALLSASVLVINDVPHILSISRDITTLRHAEEALQRSELLYRSMFEMTGLAALLFGSDGVIRKCNSYFAELVELAADDIVDKRHWSDFVHPDDLPRMKEYHARRTKGLYAPTRYQFRFLSATRREHIILITIGVIPGTELRIGTLSDITELKRVELSLRESEARLRSLQDNLPVGLFRSTPDGHFLSINPTLREILGIPPEFSLDLLRVSEFYDNLADRKRFIEQLRRHEIITNQTVKLRTLNGGAVWASMSVRGMYDSNGELLHQDGIILDITAWWKAEGERQLLLQAVDQSPSSIAIMDKDGRIEYVNPKFCATTGYSAEEVHGRLFRALKEKPETVHVHKEMWEAIRGGREWRGELQNRRKSGELYWEICQLKSVKDLHSDEAHIIAVMDDVTEDRRIQQALIVAKEKAEEMNRIKSTFLATMSHELRTPLNGILGFASLLEEELHDPSLQEMASIIHSSGNRLLETLNGILDFSVVEADKLNVNWEMVDVLRIVDDVHRLYQANAARKRLVFVVQLPDRPAELYTDGRLLRQILNNLTNNAIKYTSTGSVRIVVNHAGDDGGGMLEISVLDTGIGISRENRDLIFEDFRQVSEGYGRSYEGTGLGLSVSRKFARVLGGDITVDSEVGVGSCFTLRLPERRSVPEELAENLATEQPLLLGGRRAAITLIEQEHATNDFIEAVLRQYCQLTVVPSLERAAETQHEVPPDAVLVDVRQDEDRVLRFAIELHRVYPGATIPVAAILHDPSPERRALLKDAGYAAILSKPFTRQSLLHALHDMLQARM